jgi:hypothetical protein
MLCIACNYLLIEIIFIGIQNFPQSFFQEFFESQFAAPASQQDNANHSLYSRRHDRRDIPQGVHPEIHAGNRIGSNFSLSNKYKDVVGTR